MEKLKKGDKVMALSNSPTGGQKRVKGSRYEINAVMFCMSCGTQFVNIGEKADGEITCGGCDNIQPSKGLNWSDAKYFIKVQDKSIAELLQEALDDEDYETASKLRDAKRIQ